MVEKDGAAVDAAKEGETSPTKARGKDGKDKVRACSNCHQVGHYRKTCPMLQEKYGAESFPKGKAAKHMQQPWPFAFRQRGRMPYPPMMPPPVMPIRKKRKTAPAAAESGEGGDGEAAPAADGKTRTCGFCGQAGHYRKTCPKESEAWMQSQGHQGMMMGPPGWPPGYPGAGFPPGGAPYPYPPYGQGPGPHIPPPPAAPVIEGSAAGAGAASAGDGEGEGAATPGKRLCRVCGGTGHYRKTCPWAQQGSAAAAAAAAAQGPPHPAYHPAYHPAQGPFPPYPGPYGAFPGYGPPPAPGDKRDSYDGMYEDMEPVGDLPKGTRTCSVCGRPGHYKRTCPMLQKGGR